VLPTETRAMRDVDFDRMRYWKVINRQAKNWLGGPTGYKLEARSPVKPFTHPNSPSGRRSRFIQHQLWVTPFDPAERFPAGEFVNQSTGEDGIEAWTCKDRPIEDADIVLWHTFGLHHLPRPEDHPVQTCVVCGFALAPIGFFDQNPVIDLPSQTNEASSCAHCA
jgi:primary-amine oxidase